jgi:hypothetical protein
MARRVKTTTAKAGQTANDRRVLAQVNTVTNAPTLSTDGYLLEQNEFVHLLFKVSGTSPVFRIRIWWYSQVSGEWHKGRQIVINANDIVTAEVQGLNRVYLQVETAPTGTNPLLSAWIALVRPV